MSSNRIKTDHKPSNGSLALMALACALTLLLPACGGDIPRINVQDINPFPSEKKAEKKALVELYNATGGADCKNNFGWLTDQHIQTWHGVRYFRTSYQGGYDPISGSPRPDRVVEMVQGLALGSNGLTGEIPTDWGGLNNLWSLSLRDNQLSGEIPSGLGDLDHLVHLNLGGNQLSGEIPPELSNLGPQLRSLILRSNQLTGEIPPELGDIRDLETLDLRHNQLTGQIPSELGGFRQLYRLYLAGNHFTGCIPSGLKRLPENDFLLLNLPFCGSSNLPGDKIRWALAALYDAAGGEDWHESKNWGNTNKVNWYGASNRAAMSPRHVTLLELAENNLTGEIPPELGNLDGLRAMDLSGNNLTGEIPTELGSLDRLMILRLSGNRFTGCIPPSLLSVQWNDLWKLDLPVCGDRALSPEEIEPALLAIYVSTGGDNWRNDFRWFTDQPMDKWFGVSARDKRGSDGPQVVTGLRLMGNNLTGEIPLVLVDLKDLESLSLVGNQLTGEIPPELGNLENLESLDLSGNKLTGRIPPKVGNLEKLTELNLSGNNLTGELPTELGNLKALYALDLSGNNLTGDVTTVLGSLRGLGNLNLSGNQFTGCIPERLRRPRDIDPSELVLPFCLTGVTGALQALYNATGGDNWHDNTGWLTHQSLAKWFGISGDSTYVRGIKLPENNLTGELPTGLGNLKDLQTLDLSGNGLAGEIPPDLGNLERLVRLDLSGNDLAGEIPPELERLLEERLRVIRLGGNRFTGCIPAGLRTIEDNDFSELGLPFCLTETTGALQTLYNATGGDNWHNNTGWSTHQSLAEWFGVTAGPKIVGQVQLPENNLTGEIPPELADLTRLQYLDLRGNNLTGEIPPELANFEILKHLDLSENKLTGEISPQLGKLFLLRHLDLSGNNLTGEFSPELGGLSQVRHLDLSGNNLTGRLPAELKDMDRLFYLDLADNELQGEVPSDLGRLSRLKHLDLSGNRLTGALPSELGRMSYVQRIDLGGNQFTGEIPPELGKLERLNGLFLGGNQFTGCIPVSLRTVKDNDFALLGLPFCEQ